MHPNHVRYLKARNDQFEFRCLMTAACLFLVGNYLCLPEPQENIVRHTIGEIMLLAPCLIAFLTAICWQKHWWSDLLRQTATPMILFFGPAALWYSAGDAFISPPLVITVLLLSLGTVTAGFVLSLRRDHPL